MVNLNSFGLNYTIYSVQNQSIFLRYYLSITLLVMELPGPKDLISQPDPDNDLDWSLLLASNLSKSPVLDVKTQTGFSNPFDSKSEDRQLVFRMNDAIYSTNSNLLLHTKITVFDREKLKSWLLCQTQNLYCRETYATASRFLDMFFMQKQRVSKQEFQLLGLACLILASKVVESRVPAISFQVFSRDKIFAFEQSLMRAFSFKLNPVTYIQIAEALLHCWDTYFKKVSAFKKVIYFRDLKSCVERSRAFFQTLDCLDLVITSLDIQLPSLVACTFYLEHRRSCILSFKHSQGLIPVQDAQFSAFHQLYDQNMTCFFQDLAANFPMFRDVKIVPQVVGYVLQFCRIRPQIEIRCFKKFRQQILRQTYSEQISMMARKILRKAL